MIISLSKLANVNYWICFFIFFIFRIRSVLACGNKLFKIRASGQAAPLIYRGFTVIIYVVALGD